MEERKPLVGKKILVTRSEGQANSFSSKIRKAGGNPVELPLIQIQKITNNERFAIALKELESYDWIIFTSKNSACYFIKEMANLGINLSILNKKKIAVVGQKTADYLLDNHIKVKIVPEKFVAESLLEHLLEEISPNEKVLFPKGNLARDIIETGLKDARIKTDSIIIYETILNRNAKASLLNYLEKKQIDIVTFTSPSTVNSFFELLPINQVKKLLKGVLLACIGPITANAIRNYGVEANIIASEYTIDGLINQMTQYYKE